MQVQQNTEPQGVQAGMPRNISNMLLYLPRMQVQQNTWPQGVQAGMPRDPIWSRQREHRSPPSSEPPLAPDFDSLNKDQGVGVSEVRFDIMFLKQVVGTYMHLPERFLSLDLMS